MAETPADVRKDIELTRSRISDTLSELEQKMKVTQIVKENPWPAIALAVGAGVILSGSRADVKAAAATAVATRGATGRIGGVLDDLVAQVMQGFHAAVESKIESLASDVKRAIGAPVTTSTAPRVNYATSAPGDAAGVGAPRAD
ncbi:MAG: DUF3618 domain-containing protein [Gemmatimonadaceae bacterium]